MVGWIDEGFRKVVVSLVFIYGFREPCFEDCVENFNVAGEEAEGIQDSILRSISVIIDTHLVVSIGNKLSDWHDTIQL